MHEHQWPHIIKLLGTWTSHSRNANKKQKKWTQGKLEISANLMLPKPTQN